MFNAADLENTDADFGGFNISEKDKHVRELMEYAKNLDNPLASSLQTESLQQWMNVDDDVAVIQTMTDEEIVSMVKGGQQDQESEEEDASEQPVCIPVEKCLELGADYIAALEQLPFVTEHDIMIIYNLQSKIQHEKHNYMKQKTLDDYFKNTKKQHSSLDNPQPCTSSTPDITPASTPATTPISTPSNTPTKSL